MSSAVQTSSQVIKNYENNPIDMLYEAGTGSNQLLLWLFHLGSKNTNGAQLAATLEAAPNIHKQYHKKC